MSIYQLDAKWISKEPLLTWTELGKKTISRSARRRLKPPLRTTFILLLHEDFNIVLTQIRFWALNVVFVSNQIRIRTEAEGIIKTLDEENEAIMMDLEKTAW